MKKEVSNEVISAFLEGSDPQKYIVAIEVPYFNNIASLIVNDPVEGKYIQRVMFQPFLWMKHDVVDKIYKGDRNKIKKASENLKIKFLLLTTEAEDGSLPTRMDNGYKYMAKCDGPYTNLITFFKEGGVDPFSKDFREFFMTISPTEQFLIQTGKRLFKGMEDYDDLHRMQFDLETSGLTAKGNTIFQIGIRDNRGFEHIIEVEGDDPKILREREREAIKQLFYFIDELKPDVITGYNSEAFDWDFIIGRCTQLSIDIKEFAKGLDGSPLFRKESSLKLGGESESFSQTNLWGYSVLDASHAVRRAQAINSDIKLWNLKYITQYSRVAKANRVYVPGNILHTTWKDTDNQYIFNNTNGDWTKYNINNQEHTSKLNEGYELVSGAFIVRRYLLDDLWETEKVDGIYNQATFLLSKLIPTSFTRSSTMGTAGIWKLIMMAWSYENNLGIPQTQPQKTFTGGLSRLLEVGFAKNVAKLDYAALYPNTELTHGIFPDVDITGAMRGLLLYIAETRDISKELKGIHGDKAKAIEKELEAIIEPTSKQKEDMLTEIKYNSDLSSKYDKKQLPIKILANSFFGSLGAPHIFPWGDTFCAEETTCRGRQYLRLMVSHFHGVHGFRPLVGDTDGFNFAIPDSAEDFYYDAIGSHKLTKEFAGQRINGLKAVVAEFNEVYMEGRMGLDIDDICSSTLNFSRKNYANDINGKIKLVGNTIKSKKMPVYIEEFINAGVRLLLDGKGFEFINLYHDTVDNIVNYNIPLSKIASKARVKQTLKSYYENCKKKNKAGNPMPRQAHMELAIQHQLDINLGDTIYYVNTGSTKSHGDIKSNKLPNGQVQVDLMCKLIPTEQLESNPNLTTDEYNAVKYLAAFNTRIHPLLVCFNEDIRDKIVLQFTKSKVTKLLELNDKNIFTIKECELVSGMPFNPSDQDRLIEDLMDMEDKELDFWCSVDKEPNHIDLETWPKIKADHITRRTKEREEGIALEKEQLIELFRKLEVDDFDLMDNFHIPMSLHKIVTIEPIFAEGTDNVIDLIFKSIKWDLNQTSVSHAYEYRDDAIIRANYYAEHNDYDYGSWYDKMSESELVKNVEPVISNFTELFVDNSSEESHFLLANGWERFGDTSWVKNEWMTEPERLGLKPEHCPNWYHTETLQSAYEIATNEKYGWNF